MRVDLRDSGCSPSCHNRYIIPLRLILLSDDVTANWSHPGDVQTPQELLSRPGPVPQMWTQMRGRMDEQLFVFDGA